ncbi:hypothetical protein COUCH_35415 [Couchioplanes caeruleus]|uniref:hypothetical protein n=1 Tax=Couchioplanes caeruleus TaxID=56438 RepID=UPI0020C15DF8|nr:hypothetical protein [Couchioplanes caeruleus]UQU64195.1 hypothetical protein COUCH_35415 [Couchioplanes caeruleus]
MNSLVLTAVQSHPRNDLAAARSLLLILAVLMLVAALHMAVRALAPIREVVRALAAAAAMCALVVCALGVLLFSLIVPR